MTAPQDYALPRGSLFCEVLDGKAIHLTLPVPHHELTLCRRVVYSGGGIRSGWDRPVCQACAKRRGSP